MFDDWLRLWGAELLQVGRMLGAGSRSRGDSRGRDDADVVVLDARRLKGLHSLVTCTTPYPTLITLTSVPRNKG